MFSVSPVCYRPSLIMRKTLSEIAELVNGRVQSGRESVIIQGFAAADEAQPHDLTFYGNRKYLPQIRASAAGAILVPSDFAEEIPAVCVFVENPSAAFAAVVDQFGPKPVDREPGVHPSAVLSASATIDEGASIAPGVVIEQGAVIGERCVIGPNAVVGSFVQIGADSYIHSGVQIREHSRIGQRVIIHCGAVIGSDGFGFELVDGRHQKIEQRGIVQIDDDVEIGANVTIDRARFGRTWIQEGAKIDNLVQIAHNVVIGAHSIIVAQVGISGSSKLGKYVTLAGQVGVVGHIKIGDQSVVAAQSGIHKDVPANTVMFGYPAQEMREAKRTIAYVNRLEKLYARVKELEDELTELKQTQDQE